MQKSYGLTNWDNHHGKPQKKETSDIVKLPFVRLKSGNNLLRIITAPSVYWYVKFKDGKRPYGTRVTCSAAALDDSTKSQCPTFQAGYKPKPRYYVGVIDRTDGTAKVLDMPISVYTKLKTFKEDADYGTPDNYDINVRFDPDSGSAQDMYSVIPKPPKPLTAEDQAAIAVVGIQVIEENIARLSAPHSVERVKFYLDKLGWDGKTVVETLDTTNSTKVELAEATEDDYSFDKKTA